MNSKELKAAVLAQSNLRAAMFSATSNPTLDPYITIRIRPGKGGAWDAPLVYPGSFSLNFRQACIMAVYGEESPLAKQASAGNVTGHDIAMKAREWDRAFEIFNRRFPNSQTAALFA